MLPSVPEHADDLGLFQSRRTSFISSAVYSLAQSDDDFKEAFHAFRALLPITKIEDFFELSDDRISVFSSNSIPVASMSKKHFYFLLRIHFNRVSDRKSGDKFVGRTTKSKNSSPCLCFTREHIVKLFRCILSEPLLTHRQLEALFKFVDSEISKCTTDASREFICDGPVDIGVFIPSRKRVTTKPPTVTGSSSSSSSDLPGGRIRSVLKKLKSSSTQTAKSFKHIFFTTASVNRLRSRNAATLSKLKEREQSLGLLSEEHKFTQLRLSESRTIETVLEQKIATMKEQHKLLENQHKKLNNEYCCIADELSKLKVERDESLEAIDNLKCDPDFRDSVAAMREQMPDAKEASELSSTFPKIDMRSGKCINPLINMAIVILRTVGNCSLDKTMPTLVMLGNLVFNQNWMLSNDVSKSRKRTMTPGQNTSSVKTPVSSRTAPTKGHVRNLEKDLEPCAQASLGKEIKDPNTISATIMFDHASINRGKTQTTCLVTTTKDPKTGELSSHYRNMGIVETVRTDTDTTFSNVMNAIRSPAVLDSDSTDPKDIRASLTEFAGKFHNSVADGAAEMKPVVAKLAELQSGLGITKLVQYIHCNVHVAAAFDSAIAAQLCEVARMLKIEDVVVRKINETFFKSSNSSILTMLRAFFQMLGKSETKNQSWSLYQDFNRFLETKNIAVDRFINPSSSRFGRDAEMCFIMTCYYDEVSEFMGKVHKSNRIFDSCVLYLSCDCFFESIVAVSLVFYHIFAPFLSAVGAETQFGFKVLTDSQLLEFYPDLKQALTALTDDPESLLKHDRLPFLSKYSQVCDINKAIYRDMSKRMFIDINTKIACGDLDLDVIKSILVLVCEGFLMKIDSQVSSYYLGKDCLLAKSVKADPSLMDMVPTTSLACEHSVGMLRQSFRIRPSASMSRHSLDQVWKSSRIFSDIKSGRMSAIQFDDYRRELRKRGTFKLDMQHKRDQLAGLIHRKLSHMQTLEGARRKVDMSVVKLVGEVKNHGGPCLHLNDVDELFSRINDHS